MSNNDNAMTRFLFAILKQKNLKDIDWNKVARDPILSQEITNGHAARMRYSRFRSAMLGLEPQRRNRTAKEKANSNRVTKSKKDPKAKKDDGVKSEVAAESPNTADSPEPPATKVKREITLPAYDNRMTPTPMASTPTTSMPHVIQPRLLTPCSDTDVYATPHGIASSPTATDMFNSQTSYDFPQSHFAQEHVPWHPAPMFPAFEPTYEFDGFAMGCGHPHMHHHGEPSSVPTAMVDHEGDHINVKHEHWDNHAI
ncbi:hypothetical protein BX600DRAFT_431310 [Xylariales sp. PMI_506]|nr:hypothetical protein BX600DRAFT_431310 [Xylariales sp. PMI_506]